MPEHRGHEIARGPVYAPIVFPHSGCREGLQLNHRRRYRLLMRLDNPRIVTHQCGDRNGFGR